MSLTGRSPPSSLPSTPEIVAHGPESEQGDQPQACRAQAVRLKTASCGAIV